MIHGSLFLKKVLLIYHSVGGRTAFAAQAVTSVVKCDVMELTASSIEDVQKKIPGYGVIIIGSPVFYNDIPEVLSTVLEKADWSGVRIYPFFCCGGIYLKAYRRLKDLCRGAVISSPLAIRFDSLDPFDGKTYPGSVKEDDIVSCCMEWARKICDDEGIR